MSRRRASSPARARPHSLYPDTFTLFLDVIRNTIFSLVIWKVLKTTSTQKLALHTSDKQVDVFFKNISSIINTEKRPCRNSASGGGSLRVKFSRCYVDHLFLHVPSLVTSVFRHTPSPRTVSYEEDAAAPDKLYHDDPTWELTPARTILSGKDEAILRPALSDM